VRLLALAVPLMVLTSGLRAVLEAGQRFRVINALRVPLGLLTFLGPLAVQRVSHGLPAAVAVLAVARALVFGLHIVAVAATYPVLRRLRAPRRADVRRLWRAAGWMTVSSIVSPVLVSADRFVIGTVLPMAAVAHYATAGEVATKMWLFTAALQPVIFPAIAAALVAEPARAAALFDRGVRATVLVLAPVTLFLVLFAREGLMLWLGADFARAGAPLLQWLAIAVFVNAIASVPHTVLQSGGRADIPGKLHALELPLYLAALWWMLGRFGLSGVAAAWLLRMLFDGLAQLAAVPLVMPTARLAAGRAAGMSLGAVAVFGACAAPMPLAVRAALAAAALAVYLVAAPRWLVLHEERNAALAWAHLRGSVRTRTQTHPGTA
jgi:O-antigen/teichoic acid export membrane protein